ncbi:SGNH/GDSL hydrolase family protein [Flavitalea flava]
MLFKVKTIGLIAGVCITLGLIPETACIKNNSSLSPARIPKDTALLPNPLDTASRTYLALGDSYTIGQSVSVDDRYPAQVAALLKADHFNCKDPEIIARTGWTTGDLLYALSIKSAAPPYDYVSLLIGVNNQYQGLSQADYKIQFISLVQQSIQLAGNKPSHVIILSIPDYSVTPFAHGADREQISSGINTFNDINYEVARDYQVQYVNVTDESRKAAFDPSLIASDGLHFSGKEYAIWAALLEPVMKKISF